MTADQRDEPTLTQIQKWMQAVISHAEGLEAGIASVRAQVQIEMEPAEIERVIMPSQALSSLERLAVYSNAYHARLQECLREEYPALCTAIGAAAFDRFTVDYIQLFPSRSYTLALLGAKFPEFLRSSRPEFHTRDEDDWANLLVDLATLERTYSEVFDGPGVETAELLNAEALRTIPVEAWEASRLEFAPCVRLLALQFPVHEYATAARRGEQNIPLPWPEATWLVVTRRDYVVRRFGVSAIEFTLLSALHRGECVGTALAEAADQCADAELETFAARLGDWFRDWAANGLFLRVHLPG